MEFTLRGGVNSTSGTKSVKLSKKYIWPELVHEMILEAGI